MTHTYRGYFQNGRFIPFEPATIPDNVEVFVIVTDQKISESNKNRTYKQRMAYEKNNRSISRIKPLRKNITTAGK